MKSNNTLAYSESLGFEVKKVKNLDFLNMTEERMLVSDIANPVTTTCFGNLAKKFAINNLLCDDTITKGDITFKRTIIVIIDGEFYNSLPTSN